jgi:hypothetical protein
MAFAENSPNYTLSKEFLKKNKEKVVNHPSFPETPRLNPVSVDIYRDNKNKMKRPCPSEKTKISPNQR